MTTVGSRGPGRALRRWPVAAAPRALVGYAVVVEICAAVWAVAAVSTAIGEPAHLGRWSNAIILILLAIAFEEGTTRAARLRLRMSNELKQDMTSVWSFAAAVSLHAGVAVVVLGTVLTYVWFRQQRPAGEALYRKLFNAACAMVACLAAAEVISVGLTEWSDLPIGLNGFLPVVAGIAVYSLVDRLLVTGGLLCMRVRGHGLIGSRDDNLIEFATFCLGGLVALAILHQPWLAILVIAPLVALQRGALAAELETAARTDAKTGLLNAVAWEQVAHREIARAEREHGQVAVLILDIDRFKVVNDTYGHLAGDEVLRGVGRCLAAATREYDTVGRFGGEEFVAVLPSADESMAMTIAERVRERVSQLQIGDLITNASPDLNHAIAVSVGVACYSTDGAQLSELLYAADLALYRAKALGRNRVELAHRGDERPGFVPSV